MVCWTFHKPYYALINQCTNLFLIHTTPGDNIAIISCFKSKASSGHDGVSPKLVKDLRYALSFPLSIIINNSLAMGPDMAKLAKIIPIYKAKDKKDISNYLDQYLFYRLFLRYSKRLFIKNVMLFLRKTKSYTQVNMTFEKIDQL